MPLQPGTTRGPDGRTLKEKRRHPRVSFDTEAWMGQDGIFVRISFDTDALEIGEGTDWDLASQGEIIKNETVGGDDNIRRITAEADPFTLNGPDRLFGGSGQCADVSMTFQITVQRFNVNAGQ